MDKRNVQISRLCQIQSDSLVCDDTKKSQNVGKFYKELNAKDLIEEKKHLNMS